MFFFSLGKIISRYSEVGLTMNEKLCKTSYFIMKMFFFVD